MISWLESLDWHTFFEEHILPGTVDVLIALLILLLGYVVTRVLVAIFGRTLRRTSLDDAQKNFLRSVVRISLLAIVVIAALGRLGVETTSLVAVLGAAGLAIGLALQGFLRNFAAGILLIVFQPFRSGDYIEAAGTEGIVEKISIFSTVLRSRDNRVMIVQNGDVYSGLIVNHTARDTRRIDLVFGISYNDDIEKAKAVLAEMLAADERILDDPEPIISVDALADSSVNLIIRPWVRTPDFLDVRRDLRDRVKPAFDRAGISIPFPQMDVHMIGSQ